MPTFIATLQQSDVSLAVKLAFEFLILTATRTNEVLLATWDEIDLAAAVSTIPAGRMKAKKAHRIPLAARCVDLLKQAQDIADGTYVFPGKKKGEPLSNMVFLMALRRMNYGITAHGFRSSFRDWTAERTNFPREVCEAALAHTVRDAVEAAYRRTDLFDKRRELMATWAAFGTSAPAAVIPLRQMA